MAQLSLFPGPPAPSGDASPPSEPTRPGPAPARSGTRGEILPTPPRPEHLALRERLPARLRLGTSSWGFAGWEGLVWEGRHAEARLSREGLAAYARHPLLGAVGLDRTHYRTMTAGELAPLAAQVPERFRFLVKAHEDCSLARFPAHARYGARREQTNPRFLDPAWATEHVVGPTVEGLGERLGVLLFQFAPQPLAQLAGAGGRASAERFAERLHAFLSGLPRGPAYAVEVRNAPLLCPAYADALHDLGVTPALSVWGGLPPVEEQARRTRAHAAPLRVVRWMLHAGSTYEDAKDRYAPFSELVDPDPDTREAIARFVVQGAPDAETIVIVNNKAEGSAPRSVFALAETIAGDTTAGPRSSP